MDSPDATNSAEQTFVNYAETPNYNTPYITQLAQVGSGSQRSQQSSRQNSPVQARGSSMKTDNDTESVSPTLYEAVSQNEAAQRGNLSRNRAIHWGRGSPALSDSSAAQRSSRIQQIGSPNVLGSPSTSSIALSENESSGANTPNENAPSIRSPPLPRRFSPATLSTGVGFAAQNAARTVQRPSTPTTSSPVSSFGTSEGARLSTSQSLRSDTSIQTNPVADRAEHLNSQEKSLPWQPLKSQLSRANSSNSMASSESSYGSDASTKPVRSPDDASFKPVPTESQLQADPQFLEHISDISSHSPRQRKYADKLPSLSNPAPYSPDSRIGTHEKKVRSPLQTPDTSPFQPRIKGVRSSATNLPSSSSFQNMNPATNRSSSNGQYSDTVGASKGLNKIPQSRSEYVTQWRNGDHGSQLGNRPLQAVDGYTSTYRSPASRLRDMSPSRRISSSKVSISNPSTPRPMSSTLAPGAETYYAEFGQRSASSLSMRTQEANALKHTNQSLTSPSPSRVSNMAIQNSPSNATGSSMSHLQQQGSAHMQTTSPKVTPAKVEGGHERPLPSGAVSQSRETPSRRGASKLASTVSLPSDSSVRTFVSPALDEKQSVITSRPNETVSMSSRPVPAPPVPPRPGVAAGPNSNVLSTKLSTPNRTTDRLEQTSSPSQRRLSQSSPTLSASSPRRKKHLEESPLIKESPSTLASIQQAGSDSPGSVYSLYAQEETPVSESVPRSTGTASPLPQHYPFKPGASPSVPDYTPSPNNNSNSVQQPLSPLQSDYATLSPQSRFSNLTNAPQAIEQASATPSTTYSTPYILNGTPSLPSATPKLSGTPALTGDGTLSLPNSTPYVPDTSSISDGQHGSSPVPKSTALTNSRQDHQASKQEGTPVIEGTPSIASDTPYLGPEETRLDNSYSALGLRFPSDVNTSLLRTKVSHASIASSRSSYSDSNESDPVPHAAPAVLRESRINTSIPEHSTPTTVQAGDMQDASATKWSEIPGSRVPSTSSEAITSPLQGLSDTFATAMADLGLDDSVPPPIQGLDSVAIAYQTSPNTGRGADAQPNTTLESLLPPRTEASSTSEYGHTKLAPRADTKARMSTSAPTQESLKTAPKVSNSPREPIPTMPPAPKLEVYGMTIWWPTSFDATSNVNWDSTSTTQRCYLQACAANDLMDRDTNLTRWMMQLRQIQPRNPEVQMNQVTSAQRQKHEATFLAILDADISNASQSTLAADTSGMQIPTNIPYPFLTRTSKEHPQLNEAFSPQLSHSQSSASLHAPHSSRLDPGAAMRGAAGAAGAGWQRLQGAMPRVPSSTSFVMGTLGRRNSRRLRDPPSQPLQPAVAAHSTLNAPTSVPQRRPIHRASYYELGSPRSAPVQEIGQNTGLKSIRTASRQSEASNEPRFGLGIPGVGSRMGEDLRSVTPALLAGSLNLPPSVSKPNLAFENNLKRVMDALPDLDEATARKYLQQAQGDDVRAVSEYMQSQGDTSRRSFFSRTPRTR